MLQRDYNASESQSPQPANSTLRHCAISLGNTTGSPLYLTATHGGWLTFGNTAPSPIEVADLAWMRIQLMGDTTLRPMFYGASCTLCTDSAWQITQNSLMNQ